MMYTKEKWEIKDRWNVMAGRRLVANCGGYSSNCEDVVEENEANAQLISAAPDLYEACKDVLPTLHALQGKDSAVIRQINKALAKAEGK